MLAPLRRISLVFVTAAFIIHASTCFAENGDKQRINVSFSGLEGAVLDNVMTGVTLNRQRDMERLTDTRIRVLHERAEEEIRRAVRVFGYYNPRIESDLIRENDLWNALYRVDPGDPVRIETVDIRILGAGNEDDLFNAALAERSLHPGDQLNHGEYEAFKNHLARLARERGYFEALFSRHILRVDPAQNLAAIELEFDTGPRYRYGKVTFHQDVFDETFLQNFVPFRQGEPYHSRGPASLRQALVDSDLFSSIEIRTLEQDAADHEIPVRATLEARKRNRYTAGLGFGTDTGPRARLGWNARYLNDRGHSLNTELRVSPVLSSLSGTYLMPFFRNGPADIGLRTQVTNEDTDTALSRNAQITGFRTRKRGNWNETLSLAYLFENFEVANDQRNSKLLIPGASWWRTWGDDAIHTRHGGRLSLDLRGAAESPLADISFLQTRLQGRYIRDLGWRNRLLTRLELGATTVSDFERMPASLRFFAGGDNSIRGFDYQSLGPRDSDGRITGGRYLLVGSVEYEQFVYGNWGVAAFADFGNAVNNISDPLELGVGGGLRWLSPIGMVRLDVGIGVSRDNNPMRIHLSIGPDL